jgi:transposase
LQQANARLNAAYLLREQFEQLWSYTDPADARSFFDNWQQQLQGQNVTKDSSAKPQPAAASLPA